MSRFFVKIRRLKSHNFTDVPNIPRENKEIKKSQFHGRPQYSMSKTGDEVIPGSIAEQSVWDGIKKKRGWQVVEGRVSVRDASGQLRIYDGVAISPSGKTIGLEVKSGTARKTAAQRAFDSTLNSSSANTATGVGQNQTIVVNRSIEIRR